VAPGVRIAVWLKSFEYCLFRHWAHYPAVGRIESKGLMRMPAP
jgi:hypothetical protein